MTQNKKGNPRQFALIFSIVGLVMFCVGVKEVWESNASKTWPATQGKVLASFVRTPRTGAKSLYSPVVQYEFAVGGKKFASQRVSFGDYQSSRSSDAEAVVARYPAGTEVKVHYKAKDPAASVLEPGCEMTNIMLPLLGLVFASAGLWLLKTSRREGGAGALGREST